MEQMSSEAIVLALRKFFGDSSGTSVPDHTLIFRTELPGKSLRDSHPSRYTINYQNAQFTILVTGYDLAEKVVTINHVIRVDDCQRKTSQSIDDRLPKNSVVKFLSVEGCTEGIAITAQLCVAHDGVTSFILYNT